MPPKPNKKGHGTTSLQSSIIDTQNADFTNKLTYSKIPQDDAVQRTSYGFDALSAHTQFPHYIKLCHDEVRGRFVTATKPIKSGTVIIADQKPWAFSINSENCQKCCSACNCAITPRHHPIQCSKCNITLYCSRNCFNDHGALHMNECEALSKLPDMKFEGDTVFLRLIIRALVTRQLQMSYEKEVTMKIPIARRNKALAPFKPQPQLPWDEISSLMTHEEKLSSTILAQISNIMKTLQHTLKISWWDGEQSMYARYLYLILLINKLPIKDTLGRLVGHGLYLYPSYFNHSDTPNIVFEYGLNQKITIRALKPIAPGEELVHSYSSLYEASWQRRATLRRLFHFDPYVLMGQNTRSDPSNRIQDDFHIAGLKCGECDQGVLNFHQVKNALQPEAIIARAASGKTNLPEGEKPDVSTKPWLSLEQPSNCALVSCYGCNATYPLVSIESWLQHVIAYFSTQRSMMSESIPKLMSAKDNLGNITSLLSKSTKPLPKSEFDDMISLYSDFHKLQQTIDPSQTPPPPLFRLTSTHSTIYLTYQSLLFAAIQLSDVTSLHKYSQLLYICLSNPLYNIAMTDYYDVLMHLGDSSAFLSGNYATITDTPSARAHMIVSQEVQRAQLLKARDYYEKSLAIRRIYYGQGISNNPHIMLVESRLRNLTTLLPKK